MLSDKRLQELEKETFLLGRRWTNRYLNNKQLPSKQGVGNEMIRFVLINQELVNQVKILNEKLEEIQELRQCSMLTIAHLENQCRELEADLLLAQSQLELQQSS